MKRTLIFLLLLALPAFGQGLRITELPQKDVESGDKIIMASGGTNYRADIGDVLAARDLANRARANHTGEQAITTVTGLRVDLDSRTKHADTPAALTALSGVDAAVYQTRGRRTVGDAGGNLYYYDAGSSATCDGLFVLDGIGGDNSPGDTAATYAGTVGAGRFIAIDQSIANVKQAGAAGDDATDDTFRIQAAIDAVGSSGGEVIIPRGTYRFTQLSVPEGVYLRGSGLGIDINRATLLRATDPNVDAILLTARSSGIYDMWIEGPGNGAGTARGIVVDDGVAGPPTISRIDLKRLYVNAFPGDGIVLAKCESFVMENVTAATNGGKGVFISDSGPISFVGSITNLRVLDNEGDYQLHLDGAQNCTIANLVAGTRNLADVVNTLVRLEGSHGNIFLNPNIEGAGANSTAMVLNTGVNTIVQSGLMSNVGIGIDVILSADVILDNTYFTASVGNSIRTSGNIIESVFIRGLRDGSGGLLLNTGTKSVLWDEGLLKTNRVVLQDTHRSFAANDATPSVNVGSNYTTTNTVATTITTFDDGVNGQLVRVIIADAFTTFQHSVNMRLKGAVNFAAPVNSVLTFVSNQSGVWMEVSRTTPS